MDALLKLIEYFKSEMATVIRAPVVFLTTTAICCYLIWLATKQFFKQQVETLKAQSDFWREQAANWEKTARRHETTVTDAAVTHKLKLGLVRTILTRTTIQTLNGASQPGPQRAFAQIQVHVLRPGLPIEEARGQLLYVSKWNEELEKWALTDLDEPLDLLWSVIDRPICTLTHDAQLNIFFINEGGNQINVCAAAVPYRMADVFAASHRTDIFKFDISVSGKDCQPVYASLKIGPVPCWNNPSIEVMPHQNHDAR